MANKEDAVGIIGFIIIMLVWLISALLSLGLVATVIWAIIQVVQNYT